MQEIRREWCGGRDSNSRTPTGLGPEPSAFDLAWQPPQRIEIATFDQIFIQLIVFCCHIVLG